MEYTFLDMSDEALIEGCNLPLADGAAIALFTTGYDVEEDETVSLSIIRENGEVLYDGVVKPHNIEEWSASDASGGLAPSDVEDAPALYEQEDEISSLMEGVPFIVGTHLEFVRAMLDRSWIDLPPVTAIDLGELFRLSHGTQDRAGEPATAVSLEGIAGYYGIAYDGSTTKAVAETTLRCYRALVAEFASERDAKGPEHWEAYEREQAEKSQEANAQDRVAQIRERRYNQMNALLWVAGAIIFTSLIIQLYQRGGDVGFMIVAGAAAVFALFRAVVNWNKK